MATLRWNNSLSLEDGHTNANNYYSSNIFRNCEESELDEYHRYHETCEDEDDFGSSYNISISREECRSPPIVMRANPICHFNDDDDDDDECYISDDCEEEDAVVDCHHYEFNNENADSNNNNNLASFSTTMKFDSRLTTVPQHSFRRLRTEAPLLEERNVHKISSSQVTMICYDEMMDDATTITPSQSALTTEFFNIDSQTFLLDDMRDDDIFDDHCRSYLSSSSSRYDEAPMITQSSSGSASSICSPRSRILPTANSIISDYGDAE